jgi:hypothetical protein
MRKYVYVRIQRILMFIPIVNVSIMVMWTYNCHVLPIPKGAAFKADFKAVCYVMILWLFQYFICEIFGIDDDTIVGDTLGYIFMYIIPFAMAYSLVRSQEKLGLE